MQLRAPESQGRSSRPSDLRVRNQLERILANDLFTRSTRLSAFLRYVVEQTLNGQGSVLKEQVLGTELYGRGQAFDGTSDAIVRVDARRLRDKLREYYAECPRDSILISLPKGSYVPSFEENQNDNPFEPPAQHYVVHVPGRMRWSWLAAAVVLTSVIGAVVFWSLLPRSAKPADRAVLITTSGVSPGISPDGRFITFSGRGTAEDTTADIWVKSVEGGALRRLTSTPEFWETFPAWSPDGRKIAFMRENQGIFVIPQSGGTAQRVSSGTWADWAPDGKSLIVRDREREGAFGMYQVFLETGERRRLTQPLLGDGDWRAAVSPDGSTLAFARHEPSNGGDLYVVPMQGGEPRRVTNWNARLTGVAWTPDGRDLIYSHEGLWRISANRATPGRGSHLESVSAEVNNFAISRPSYGQPARIVFQAYHRRLSFQVIDLAGPTSEGVFRRVKPFPVSTQFESPGPFSPDDRQFAFVSGRPPQVRISVSDTDGGGVRQIASLDKPPSLGSWSHDGGKIVYSASINGNSDIFVVDTNGGSSRRLTFESSEESFPSYSRNGRWIYFSSTVAGALDIWRIPAEGGPAVRITYHGGVQAREAPDGYLYYVDRYPPNERMMRPHGTSRLMRVPANGSGPEMEVLKGLTAYWWSMADSGVFFISHESGFKGVDFIDFIDYYSFSDRKVRRIGRLATRAGQINPQMHVSSDGRWALVSTNVVYANLMLIDNIR